MSGSRSSVRAQGDQTVRIGLAYGLIAVALLLVGAYIGWNYMLSILLFCIVSAIMSLGVNIQWGYAGLFNAGIMGFTALGGLTAVLVSYAPVNEAWAAAGIWPWAFFASMLISILIGVVALRILPKGNNRLWVVGLIAFVGFFVSRWFYFQATPLIEAVNPAGTGFLGGLGIYDWPILSLIPGWALIGSLIVFLLGGVVAAGAAFLIGKLTLGLRADYLAIATLGISEIVIFFLKNEEWLTRGVKNVTTLPRPITQPVDLIEAAWFQNFVNGWFGGVYTDEQLRSAASLVVKLGYVALFSLVLLVIFILAQRALNSPWGRMMRAIRDNEVSANAMGKNIVGRHLEVFVLGSAVVGIAGAMLTTVVGQFTPTEYIPLRFTFLIWVMVIVGGSGNNFGSVFGGFLIWFVWILAEPIGGAFMDWATTSAIFFVLPSIQDLNATLAQHLVDVAPQIRLMLMGIVLLLVLRFSPSGILPEVVPGRVSK